MEFAGRYHLAAPPEAVWDGLNDAGVLKACIPGCETLEKTGMTEFTATVTLKIGPMTARFSGKITLAEMEPPRRGVLRGEGSGAAGFAKGDAVILLAPAEGGTNLTYTVKAAIGGKLAQIGQRFIDGTARQIADDFFRRFGRALAQQAAPDPATVELPPPSAPPRPPSAKRAGSAVWLAGLAAIMVVLLGLFWLVL